MCDMVVFMRRHCGRPGCNAVATATFSFDATRCVVWLNPIADGTPRAGDLCTRHADGMAPPKGWERIDHRSELAPVPKAVTDDLLPNRETPKRKRKAAGQQRWDEVPGLFDPAAAAAPIQPAEQEQPKATPSDPTLAEPETPWMPRFANDDDLAGVLDASTPLLSRAFRNARPSDAGDGDDRIPKSSD